MAYTGVWWGNLRERDLLEDPDIDGRKILRWIIRKWDWIYLAQDRDRWRALVNAVMNELTACSGVVEKLTVPQLVKKFPAFNGTLRFITAHSQEPVPCLSKINPVHVPISALWRYILILSSLNNLVNIILLNSDEHHKITAQLPIVIRRATWRAQSLYDEGIGVRFVAGIR